MRAREKPCIRCVSLPRKPQVYATYRYITRRHRLVQSVEIRARNRLGFNAEKEAKIFKCRRNTDTQFLPKPLHHTAIIPATSIRISASFRTGIWPVNLFFCRLENCLSGPKSQLSKGILRGRIFTTFGANRWRSHVEIHKDFASTLVVSDYGTDRHNLPRKRIVDVPFPRPESV